MSANPRVSALEAVQVSRDSLSEQVANQIANLIVEGGLLPGDRLPPERQLAEQLGVSRTVVREVTKTLQERGLLRILTGSGTYVSRVSPETVSQAINLFVRGNQHSFSDVFEIRLLLEVEIAGLAAARAGQDEIQVLETAVRQMEQALPAAHRDLHGVEEFVQTDLLFHNALAKAAHNSLLLLLLVPIADLLLEIKRQASALPGAPENAIRYHRAIVERINGRDPQGAREVMHAHLLDAADWIGAGRPTTGLAPAASG